MAPVLIHRRAFMAATLGAVSAVSATDSRRRQPITLGFSLYGMAAFPVPEAITAAARIGYDDVEMASLAGSPGDPDQLDSTARVHIRKVLQKHRLRISAFMENLKLVAEDPAHRENLVRIRRIAQLAKDLGGAKSPILETILGGQPGDWEASKEAMVSKLKEWAATAAAECILIAIKPHVRNAMQTPAQAEWLRARVASPWLRFTYDYSHFYLQRLPLKETLQTLVPYTAFVHVKDAAGTVEQPQFQLPGAGGIDYVSYLRLLRKHGYRGSVTVEVSAQIHRRPDYDPLDAAQRSYNVLAKAWKEAS
jgi:sugar phosphate isomerase/epimerase